MVELLLAELLFAMYLPRRLYFFLRYLACAAGCAVIGYVTSALYASTNKSFLLSFLFFFLCSIGAQVACVKTNIWNYLFVGIAGYTTQRLAHQPKNIALIYNYGKVLELSGGALSRSAYETLLLLPCILVVYSLVWWYFARKIKKNGLDTKDKRLLIVSVIALVFMIVLSGVTDQNLEQGYLIRLYATVCCVLTLFLLGSLASEKKSGNRTECVEANAERGAKAVPHFPGDHCAHQHEGARSQVNSVSCRLLFDASSATNPFCPYKTAKTGAAVSWLTPPPLPLPFAGSVRRFCSRRISSQNPSVTAIPLWAICSPIQRIPRHSTAPHSTASLHVLWHP